jgi:hypothetical protein
MCLANAKRDRSHSETLGNVLLSPHQEMPAAEKIATALLQLKNNPRLFDRWVSRSGAFKADGALFSRCGVN